MNWKIIIGGVLIFLGFAQFIKVFSEYQYTNSRGVSIGLAMLFAVLTIAGVFLVREGRKENRLR